MNIVYDARHHEQTSFVYIQIYICQEQQNPNVLLTNKKEYLKINNLYSSKQVSLVQYITILKTFEIELKKIKSVIYKSINKTLYILINQNNIIITSNNDNIVFQHFIDYDGDEIKKTKLMIYISKKYSIKHNLPFF
jgi:hypothetical protein